jgi:hypothetical protein
LRAFRIIFLSTILHLIVAFSTTAAPLLKQSPDAIEVAADAAIAL